MQVLEAKAARGELTERQVVKLAALRAAMRPPIVNEAIAAALAQPRRSARLAGKPRIVYQELDEEVAEEVVPRRSARLAAKPRVSYEGMDESAGRGVPTVGQQRYEAAVAALMALRS